jgi:hypothetical protein
LEEEMKRKIALAIEAVDNIFSDTSVSQEETLDALAEVRESIEMKIECLKSDIRRAQEKRK